MLENAAIYRIGFFSVARMTLNVHAAVLLVVEVIEHDLSLLAQPVSVRLHEQRRHARYATALACRYTATDSVTTVSGILI